MSSQKKEFCAYLLLYLGIGSSLFVEVRSRARFSNQIFGPECTVMPMGSCSGGGSAAWFHGSENGFGRPEHLTVTKNCNGGSNLEAGDGFCALLYSLPQVREFPWLLMFRQEDKSHPIQVIRFLLKSAPTLMCGIAAESAPRYDSKKLNAILSPLQQQKQTIHSHIYPLLSTVQFLVPLQKTPSPCFTIGILFFRMTHIFLFHPNTVSGLHTKWFFVVPWPHYSMFLWILAFTAGFYDDVMCYHENLWVCGSNFLQVSDQVFPCSSGLIPHLSHDHWYSGWQYFTWNSGLER